MPNDGNCLNNCTHCAKPWPFKKMYSTTMPKYSDSLHFLTEPGANATIYDLLFYLPKSGPESSGDKIKPPQGAKAKTQAG